MSKPETPTDEMDECIRELEEALEGSRVVAQARAERITELEARVEHLEAVLTNIAEHKHDAPFGSRYAREMLAPHAASGEREQDDTHD